MSFSLRSPMVDEEKTTPVLYVGWVTGIARMYIWPVNTCTTYLQMFSTVTSRGRNVRGNS